MLCFERRRPHLLLDTARAPRRTLSKFFANFNYSQIQSVVSMTRIAIIFV